MRENRLYGSEGGGALTRSPYPHRGQCPDAPLDPSRQPLALLEDARDVKVPGGISAISSSEIASRGWSETRRDDCWHLGSG